MTALELITNALYEINAVPPGETASSDDAALGLSKLNRLLDNWNAESLFIYGTTLSDFTLTINHNPHTIGVSGSGADFIVATARPPKIEAAALILTDQTPNIYSPLEIVDGDWWINNPTPTLATQVPYYLYPNYSWPLGQIYLWPVPTTAYGIRLKLWTLLSQLALTDTFSLPPGYQDAITLSLAESLTAPHGAQLSPILVKNASEARARIKSLNSEAPTMTCDAAVQSVDSLPLSSMANFLSGFFN
jgi:hypothetical protein